MILTSMRRRTPAGGTIPIGITEAGWLSKTLKLPIAELLTHIHLAGVSESGKSRWLASFYLSLLKAGLAATFIDPHGETAQLIFRYLVATGAYDRPEGFERVVYLDLPAAERHGRFVPFNVLALAGSPHTIAANVTEAFHRAWPQLAGGAAPMFDTLMACGLKILIANGQPITSLYRLLTDAPFRAAMLAALADPDVAAFFQYQYDRLGPREQAIQAGATLRRAFLLTDAPVLKYSLGQADTVLDFGSLLNSGRSLIVNLALGDLESKRLFGCLLAVSAEQAALARSALPLGAGVPSHHLFIDEFGLFAATSEEAMTTILSQTRKFGLYLVMAHQTWSQTSARLKGAMQNVMMEMAFRLGRDDAQHAARIFGRVEPRTVRQDLSDAGSESIGMAEGWERWTQALQDLPPRHAYLRTKAGAVTKLRTLNIPDPDVDPAKLAAVEAHYLDHYFRPVAAIEADLATRRAPAPGASPPTRRTRRLE